MRYLHLYVMAMMLLSGFSGVAQEKNSEVSVKFSGLLRNDFYMDTYKSMNMTNDLYYYLPNYIGVDANGHDLNQQASVNFLAIESRFTAAVSGPMILGAKSTGVLEADFAGKPDVYLLRLRKSFIQLNWKNSALLVGQTWHPFGGGNVFPTVPSVNNGAPFRPFSRTPQIRYDRQTGNLTTSLTALYQHLYVSNGPQGPSSYYKREALIPEMVLGIDWTKNGLSLGGNIDYNTLKPRIYTTGSNGKTYVSNEILTSMSYMVYGRYQKKKLTMLFQGFLGRNLAHMSLNSGYGISGYDPSTGSEKYTNYNGIFSVFNLTYGIKWRPGILLGYAKNLGTSEPLYKFVASGKESATVWGTSTTTRNTYRFAPFLSYLESRYSLQLEYELTAAEWGVGDIDFSNGLYASYHNTTNHGVRMVMIYNF